MLQVVPIGTNPPVHQQTAASAFGEEDEVEEAAASAVHMPEAVGSPTAKRQKMSGPPGSEDPDLAQQPIEEARRVAAATKNALGLTGRLWSRHTA